MKRKSLKNMPIRTEEEKVDIKENIIKELKSSLSILSDKYKDNSIYYKNGKLKSDAEYSIQIYIRSAEREGFDDLVKQIKKEYNIV